jgi:hypothetical protein
VNIISVFNWEFWFERREGSGLVFSLIFLNLYELGIEKKKKILCGYG